jgi:hypothetical protein
MAQRAPASSENSEEQKAPSAGDEVIAGTPETPDLRERLTPEEVERLLRYLEEQEQIMRPYFNPRPGHLRKRETEQDFFNMTRKELEEYIRRQQQQLLEPFGQPEGGLTKDW